MTASSKGHDGSRLPSSSSSSSESKTTWSGEERATNVCRLVDEELSSATLLCSTSDEEREREEGRGTCLKQLLRESWCRSLLDFDLPTSTSHRQGRASLQTSTAEPSSQQPSWRATALFARACPRTPVREEARRQHRPPKAANRSWKGARRAQSERADQSRGD